MGKPNGRRDSRALVRALACGVGRSPAWSSLSSFERRRCADVRVLRWCCRSSRIRCPHRPLADIDDRFGELVGVPRAFGGHSSRPLRASKLSSALWSKTLARCLAFSSGHTSTVDSVPSGSIRMTCHPKDLASYRSRFILRICAQTRRFSSLERRRNHTASHVLPA